jgi:hypothetical protein
VGVYCIWVPSGGNGGSTSLPNISDGERNESEPSCRLDTSQARTIYPSLDAQQRYLLVEASNPELCAGASIKISD